MPSAGRMLEGFWKDFGRMLEGCWKDAGRILKKVLVKRSILLLLEKKVLGVTMRRRVFSLAFFYWHKLNRC